MSPTQRQSAWAVAEAYILSRQATSLPLSTAAAVQHLKQTLTECEHTDEELVQLVAISAIRHGRSLAFDGPFTPDHKALERAAREAL